VCIQSRNSVYKMTDFKLRVRSSTQFGRHLEMKWKYLNCNDFFSLFFFFLFFFSPCKESYLYAEQRPNRLMVGVGFVCLNIVFYQKQKFSNKLSKHYQDHRTIKTELNTTLKFQRGNAIIVPIFFST